jgi:uncharacterized protein (DUF58 family)
VRRAAAVASSGAGLTLVALLFDAAPLFVPGIALGVLGVLTPVWIWLAARGTTVRRKLRTDRVIEGEPVEVTIDIRRGLIPAPGLEVVDPLGAERVGADGAVTRRRAGRRTSVELLARFPRRGRHRLGPPAVVLRDPLDLTRSVTVGHGSHEVLVLPRTERVNWLGRDLGARFELSGGRVHSEPLAAAELDGLRPYRPGTPASRIHWAAVARGAGLLERRMRADGDTRPLVVLDARCADPADEQLDAAVRAAASLVLELARRGGCGLLLPGERRPVELDPELRGWPAAHARLAVVSGGPASPAPVLSHGSRLGRIFYVAAEAPRRLPQALGASGQPPAVLVVPDGTRAPGRADIAFEVAGCEGYVLGAPRRTGLAKELA